MPLNSCYLVKIVICCVLYFIYTTQFKNVTLIDYFIEFLYIIFTQI